MNFFAPSDTSIFLGFYLGNTILIACLVIKSFSYISFCDIPAPNGLTPYKSSKKMTPNDHTSTLHETFGLSNEKV
jgi:hypothetical protein